MTPELQLEALGWGTDHLSSTGMHDGGERCHPLIDLVHCKKSKGKKVERKSYLNDLDMTSAFFFVPYEHI